MSCEANENAVNDTTNAYLLQILGLKARTSDGFARQKVENFTMDACSLDVQAIPTRVPVAAAAALGTEGAVTMTKMPYSEDAIQRAIASCQGPR